MDKKALETYFFEHAGGHAIRECIQCGTCGGSCPLADQMDYSPRALFALIRDGEILEALHSEAPWLCVSCYNCAARCPREIPVTDLMYALKRLAAENNLAPRSNKTKDLYEAFAAVNERFGRITEPAVMARYALGHPMAALANARLGLALFQRGRLEFRLQKMKTPGRLRKLLGGRGGRP
ncbi:MAG: 4Fe-4S dicluster domain-containing protein [Pseudomonadota bacterium]